MRRFVSRLWLGLCLMVAAAPCFADVKVSVQTGAMPATAVDQDQTSGTFSSDVKGAVTIFSRGVTANTIAEEGGLSIGVLGSDASQGALSAHDDDAIGTATDVYTEISATNNARMADAASNSSIAEAAGSILSNGIRLGWTDINAQELISSLIIGGSDVEAKFSTATLNGTTDVTVSHGLSAAPSFIIAINNSAGVSGNSLQISVGFYDVGGNAHRTMSSRHAGAAATTAISQAWSSTAIAYEQSNSAITWFATINDVDADSFDIVANAATTDVVRFLAVRCVSCDIQVGDFTTKTSTGTQADITGMSQAPTAVMYLTSFLASSTATDTVVNATNSESFGFGMAANNGGTEQAATAAWSDDAVALGTTDTKSLHSNTKAGVIFNGSGALGVDWSISSWDSGGVTNNYSTADATARRVVYLAIGPPPGVAAPAFDTAPNVTATSATSYTISYDADANTDTIFCGAYAQDATAPTGAQLEAETGAIDASNEAATGSADSIALVLTSPDPFPVHDAYCVGAGPGGYSSVVAMVDEFKDAPTGYLYVVKSGDPGIGEFGVLDGASPPAVDGDTMQCKTTADSFALGDDAHTLTCDPDTTFVIGPPSDPSRLFFDSRFYDRSLFAWSDPTPVAHWVNNAFPVFVGPDVNEEEGETPFLYERGVTLNEVLDTWWTDAEGDSMPHTVTNMPAGGNLTSNETITGAFTAYGYYPTVVLRATDITGDFTDAQVTIIVGLRLPAITQWLRDESLWGKENIFAANDSFFYQAMSQ